jgi:hypothetical protein
MLDNTQKSNIFSIWENIKKEKADAVSNGITSAGPKSVLLVDGY